MKKVVDEIRRDGKLAWAPDSKRIAFMATGAHNRSDIFIVNVGSGEKRNLTNNNFTDRAPCWSPDGKTIVFESLREKTYDLFAIDSDGGKEKKITDTPEWNRFPRLSPDGAKVVFKSSASGKGNTAEICVVNIDGTGFRKLTDNSFFDGAPDW